MTMISRLTQKIEGLKNTIALRYFRNNPDSYMKFLYKRQMKRLDQIIQYGDNPFNEADWSAGHYEEWDDRELRDLENPKRGWHTLIDGELRWASAQEIRDRFIDCLCREIDAAIADGAEPSVLEVGCGNATNLVALKERYGDKLRLSGFDVANQRVAVGKQYYGNRLTGVDMRVASVADPNLPELYKNTFGIVFSMHCLEQIPNLAAIAVENMLALSSGRVVMIEPDWEHAYPAQRVYLIVSDHMRTLLKTCQAKGAKVLKGERFELQSSLKNPSTLIVLNAKKA